MNTYYDSEKPCGQYKYTLIIDNNTYKYNTKKNLIKRIEQDFNITGVKHWIANLKVPKIYHHKFNYVEFNGNIIHDIKNKKYKEVIINGQTIHPRKKGDFSKIKYLFYVILVY